MAFRLGLAPASLPSASGRSIAGDYSALVHSSHQAPSCTASLDQGLCPRSDIALFFEFCGVVVAFSGFSVLNDDECCL